MHAASLQRRRHSSFKLGAWDVHTGQKNGSDKISESTDVDISWLQETRVEKKSYRWLIGVLLFQRYSRDNEAEASVYAGVEIYSNATVENTLLQWSPVNNRLRCTH